MLIVDTRAGSSKLIEPLRRRKLPVEEGLLNSGDVAWMGRGVGDTPVHIGVEYKKLAELVTSLRDDRLAGHQLLKMQKDYDYSYLLVEGEILYDEYGMLVKRGKIHRRKFTRMAGRMSANEMRKRLFTLTHCGGLTYLQASDVEDSCEVLQALYRFWTDSALDEHRSHIAVYRPPALVPLSEFRVFMQSFKGISFETSKAIERHFWNAERSCGDLGRALLAGRDEWLLIPGVGKVLADHIQRVLHP